MAGVGAEKFLVAVGVNPGHEFPIGGLTEVERCPSVGSEVVFHVLACPCVLPAGPGLDVRLVEFPCLDPFQAEDISVDLFE